MFQIELKLKKQEAERWLSLESDLDAKFAKFPSAGLSITKCFHALALSDFP